jgi:endogenous inhibitor of DNA gyrase (YacG/DUF329 family)
MAQRKRPPCPICEEPLLEAERRHRPFCSARCRQVDLGRWLGGEYALPSEEPVGDDDFARALAGEI